MNYLFTNNFITLLHLITLNITDIIYHLEQNLEKSFLNPLLVALF